jgi:hypothetical protein
VDKLTADAVELKAGYDKLSVDSSEQKAQVRRLLLEELWTSCVSLCMDDNEA